MNMRSIAQVYKYLINFDDNVNVIEYLKCFYMFFNLFHNTWVVHI